MICTNTISNAQALIGVFGFVPDFIGSEVLCVELDLNQRKLRLIIMTTCPVKNIPKRWAKEWNVVYVEILFYTMDNLDIKGNTLGSIITKFNLEENLVELSCKNDLNIKFTTASVQIMNITPGLIEID